MVCSVIPKNPKINQHRIIQSGLGPTPEFPATIDQNCICQSKCIQRDCEHCCSGLAPSWQSTVVHISKLNSCLRPLL